VSDSGVGTVHQHVHHESAAAALEAKAMMRDAREMIEGGCG
jgi:hypothetical protein